MQPDEKAKKMREKTEEVRRMFNLPESEVVVQDYHCKMWSSFQYVHGHMWVTPNFVTFHSGFPSITESLPFRKVQEIKNVTTQVLFSGVEITLEGGTKQTFAGFTHFDETFTLLKYLWKHPVSYVQAEGTTPTGSSAGSSSPIPGTAKSQWGSGGSGDAPAVNNAPTKSWGAPQPGRDTGSSWGSGAPAQQQQQLLVQGQVDTQTSRNLVKLALEARQAGADTLTDLETQAEAIDRIEYNIDNIHYNLDKAEKHLRGIESVSSAIANSFAGPDKKPAPVFNPADRKIVVKEREQPDVEYEILFKHPDDHFSNAFLRFGGATWTVVAEDKKTPLTKPSSYEPVEKVVLRARHLHIDVRFRGKDPTDKENRVRMCTSFMQYITNEFWVRTKGQVKVEFEPGVRKFEFQVQNIDRSQINVSRTGAPSTGFGRLASKDKFATSNLISDPEKKAQLQQQEADIDEASLVIGDLKQQALAMSPELIRSKEQLERIDTKTQKAQQRIEADTKRINTQIRNN